MANFNKAKKYHFIYKTTNLLNNRYYIGMHSTNNINDGYIGSGKKLRNSINKYGIENFTCEILEFLPDRNSLANREKELVNEDILKDPQCMNLIIGGKGGFISNEQQLRRSIAGTTRHKYLLETSDEYKTTYLRNFKAGIDRLYQSGHYHKKHTIETKAKIKISMKGKGIGKKNSQFGTCWITNDFENKKIKKIELNNFIELGWRLGRIFL